MKDGKGEFIMGTGRFAGIRNRFSYIGLNESCLFLRVKRSQRRLIIEGTQTILYLQIILE